MEHAKQNKGKRLNKLTKKGQWFRTKSKEKKQREMNKNISRIDRKFSDMRAYDRETFDTEENLKLFEKEIEIYYEWMDYLIEYQYHEQTEMRNNKEQEQEEYEISPTPVKKQTSYRQDNKVEIPYFDARVEQKKELLFEQKQLRRIFGNSYCPKRGCIL